MTLKVTFLRSMIPRLMSSSMASSSPGCGRGTEGCQVEGTYQSPHGLRTATELGEAPGSGVVRQEGGLSRPLHQLTHFSLGKVATEIPRGHIQQLLGGNRRHNSQPSPGEGKGGPGNWQVRSLRRQSWRFKNGRRPQNSTPWPDPSTPQCLAFI